MPIPVRAAIAKRHQRVIFLMNYAPILRIKHKVGGVSLAMRQRSFECAAASHSSQLLTELVEMCLHAVSVQPVVGGLKHAEPYSGPFAASHFVAAEGPFLRRRGTACSPARIMVNPRLRDPWGDVSAMLDFESSAFAAFQDHVSIWGTHVEMVRAEVVAMMAIVSVVVHSLTFL